MKFIACLIAALVAAAPAAAQTTPRTILFVGNSFTFGFGSPVRRYRPETVTDLNSEGVGGVPAVFKRFTEQVGLDYRVSLETSGGKDFAWHIANRLPVLDRAWDVVVLQGFSTLEKDRPGDTTRYVADAVRLAETVTRRNPRVNVQLVATWTRADLTYRPGSPWSGKPVTAMAQDIQAAAERAWAASRDIDGIVTVGTAWTRAMAAGVADPNPYDGIAFGQVDLWTFDQYHASAAGYYLEALMIFGRVTGVDPRRLGTTERAAEDLGLSPTLAGTLQRVAAEQMGFR